MLLVRQIIYCSFSQSFLTKFFQLKLTSIYHYNEQGDEFGIDLGPVPLCCGVLLRIAEDFKYICDMDVV